MIGNFNTPKKFQCNGKTYTIKDVDAATLNPNNKGTRYVIMDEGGRVVNDAQGHGYKTESAAIRAFQFVGSEAYIEKMEKRYSEPEPAKQTPRKVINLYRDIESGIITFQQENETGRAIGEKVSGDEYIGQIDKYSLIELLRSIKDEI